MARKIMINKKMLLKIGVGALIVVILLIAVLSTGNNQTQKEQSAPAPDTQAPITISQQEFSADKGGTISFELALQNGDVAQNVIPQISCTPLQNVRVFAQTLDANEIGRFPISANIAQNVPSGPNQCHAIAQGVGRVNFLVTVN